MILKRISTLLMISRLKVFLCHASEDRNKAEKIQLALTAAGFDVFFDEQSLPPSGDYQAQIQAAVTSSDFFIFILTNHSIKKGKYTLTELQLARDKWPHPQNRVIPVNLDDVTFDQIPNYLQATTVLTVQGNAAAEVRVLLEKLRISQVARMQLLFASVLIFFGVIVMAMLTYTILKTPSAKKLLLEFLVSQDDSTAMQPTVLSEVLRLNDPLTFNGQGKFKVARFFSGRNELTENTNLNDEMLATKSSFHYLAVQGFAINERAGILDKMLANNIHVKIILLEHSAQNQFNASEFYKAIGRSQKGGLAIIDESTGQLASRMSKFPKLLEF